MQASKIRAKDEAVRPHSAAAPKSSSLRPPSGTRPRSAVVSRQEHRPADPATLPDDVQPAAWDLEVCSDCAREEVEQRQKPFSIEYTPTPQPRLRDSDPVS